MEINIEERKQHAVDNFKTGYNCSQAVFLAFADIFELDERIARQISAPFGGGMGRLGEVCGALSGAFMTVGLKYPVDLPGDKMAKAENYKAVQRVAAPFREKFGSIICRDLLDAKKEKPGINPNDPNAEYFTKKPCAYFVAEAAESLGLELRKAVMGIE